MKYFYTPHLHPEGFWSKAKPILFSEYGTPEYYRLIGLSYDCLLWLHNNSHGNALDIIPLSKDFFECVCLHTKIFSLDAYIQPIPNTLTNQEFRQLCDEVFIEWPLIQKNSLVINEQQFGECGTQLHEYLDCCSFHRRMLDLWHEQLGREYILCLVSGIKSPDLTQDSWVGKIMAHTIIPGQNILLINYITQERIRRVHDLFK